jgi:hypothetical protein
VSNALPASIQLPGSIFSQGAPGFQAASLQQQVYTTQQWLGTVNVQLNNNAATFTTTIFGDLGTNTATTTNSRINVLVEGQLNGGGWQQISPPIPEAPEERARREAYAAVQIIANKRADRLLVSLLTTRQKKMWMAMGFLLLPSATMPGVVYKVQRSTHMIRMYRDGVPEVDLCVHENEGLPLSDRVIAMKFLLETEESEIHKYANRHAVPIHSREPLRPELLKLARAA